MSKVRLDLYLVEHNYVPSRSKASEMIKNNKVFVNNKLVNKPSFEVDEIDIISISENDILKYVSRGGLKLEKAINEFSLNLDGLTILDIGASTGTAIRAADGGTVTLSGWYYGYGLTVIIDHGGGYKTLYGHNSANYVSVGEKVFQGQTIAAVGNTGYSTGPHLHFEIQKHGVPVNPYNYF